MRETAEKFYFKNKTVEPYFTDLNQDKLNSLVYSIHKMAYMFIANLQAMFNFKKNRQSFFFLNARLTLTAPQYLLFTYFYFRSTQCPLGATPAVPLQLLSRVLQSS